MKHLICIIFLFLLIPATTAQVKPVTAELGVQAYATLTKAGGYQWIVRGNIYPLGTYTARPGAAAVEPCGVVAAQPIGDYAIWGSYGNEASHLATYRITINGRTWAFQGLVEYYEDNGFPGATLYPGGLIGARAAGDVDINIEYTPRSKGCFGGMVKVYEQEK